MKKFNLFNAFIVVIVSLLLFSCSSGSSTDSSNETGTFTDPRDGKTYKTVKIGSQVWMAENLNFYTNANSFCYDDDSSNCAKYGRLYTYEIAQEVCPTGWHLPSKAEFEILLQNYGGAGNSAYIALKEGGNSGFDAPLGGWLDSIDRKFSSQGDFATFWSSSPASSNKNKVAWRLDLDGDHEKAYVFYYGSSAGMSVRCLQD
jgi:uncharacterized protein (TIGR02145 family)